MTTPAVRWLERAVAPELAQAAVVLINTPQSREVIGHVWDGAGLRVVTDGAADRLSQMAPELCPDLVIGDMDSACQRIVSSYEARGAEVADMHEDQDSTDLTKALNAAAAKGFRRSLIMGEYMSADRPDHSFGIINSLFMCQKPQGSFDEIMVVSPLTVMRLLPPGDHVLATTTGSKCGLVPLAGSCASITTSGLEWDMDAACMAFGGLVSTSNIAASDEVTVANSDPVIWTMTFLQEEEEGGEGVAVER